MLEPWVARSALSMRECGVGRGVLPTALPAPFSTTLSPALSVYLHNCRIAVSASAGTACPVLPTLRQSQSRHRNVSPLHPGACLRPSTSLDVCFFFMDLVSDFLDVRFSVSSGCARRCSVSTYAAILVLIKLLVFNLKF